VKWSRPRAATAAILPGIVVQGVILLATARGDAGPGLRWRGLFLAFAALTLLASFLEYRRRSRVATAAMLLAAGLLAFGAWRLPARTPAVAPAAAVVPAAAGADDPAVAAATARLQSQFALLRTWTLEQGPDLAAATGKAGGALFRVLDPLPARWSAAAGDAGLPLAAAVWQDGQRVAWTAATAPLDLPEVTAGKAPADDALVLGEYREAWYVRRFAALGDGRQLECQLALPRADAAWLGANLEIVTGGVRRGEHLGAVDPDGDASPLSVRLRPAPGAEVAVIAARARMMALMLVGWIVLLAVAAGRFGGIAPLLVALWLGRAFLAAADLRRWLVAAFPGVDYPTAPGSWASLIDPAYFATPVLGGWFASTGDALLTALLLGVTVWRLRPRPAGPAIPEERTATVPVHGAGRVSARAWVAAAAFGALAGLLLPSWRALGRLMAENANARLIGPGVSLSFLTFWGLHVALLLLALAALGLLVSAAARLPRPAAGTGAALARAGLLAALAATVTAVVPGGGSRAILPVVALALLVWWFGRRQPSGGEALRRAAWPALLLAAALGNYTSLRQVHDGAERAWLQRRAAALTEADAGWMRFLVQSVLAEMQQADVAGSSTSPAVLWRDETAWRLYRDSALYDLGYPCQVEILDADERRVSLFATGFLRDFGYQTMTRSTWLTADGAPAGPDDPIAFLAERRLYNGGQEEILVAEGPRRSGRGWLRLETPLRSWRISTLAAPADDAVRAGAGGYRPRPEVDRPVLMLLADDGGWRGSGAEGFPGVESDALVADLRAGRREWAVLPVGGADWLCRWTALPAAAARAPGEGFLVGIRRAAAGETLLDVSRLLLVEVLLLAGLFVPLRLLDRWRHRARWQPGFQGRFLAAYLALGLALLLVIGLSVDRLGYDRVRDEARQQAREGLTMALQQLGDVLAVEARALADSGRLDALAGGAPAVADLDADLRQVVLYRDDGAVLFDGSSPALTPVEAEGLLQAVRSAPLALLRDGDGVQAVIAVPVALGPEAASGDAPQAALAAAAGPGHGGVVNDGVLLYRQDLDSEDVASLAALLRGEVTVSLDGTPVFASHPESLFEGLRPPLSDPGLMAALFDHPLGPGLASPPGRPFACDAAQPLPAFARGADGRLARRLAPAVLGVSFPGREREFAAQRRASVLFLAGLANLVLLTALVLAALMSWSLFRPLRVLMGATRSLARGDFAAPLPPPGHDEVGRLADAFATMRERLRHAQDDLAARERFLATVLERVTVGVAVLSPAGALVVVNPAGRAILERFWPGEPAAAGAARLRDGLAARRSAGPGSAVAGELAGGGGRLTLRGALAPLDEAEPDGDMMVVFEDVSEFLATKKLALNAELARQVAHEIKNPLTPIQLSVQLLGQAWHDRHPQLDRIVPDTVERVLDQVDLLRRIASEFSLLGRPDELPLAPVDLPALVARVGAAYAGGAEAGEGGPLRCGPVPPGLPPVLAHEESLHKILGNLMQNSLDAARPGVAPMIEVSWRATDHRVRLRWRDNGAGLSGDVADRLFEPYFSTKSKGTGLGLAICRSLAERMGGTISLANRADGPGAEAVLELAAAGTPEVRG
jgi:signal transduction histidine kinase